MHYTYLFHANKNTSLTHAYFNFIYVAVVYSRNNWIPGEWDADLSTFEMKNFDLIGWFFLSCCCMPSNQWFTFPIKCLAACCSPASFFFKAEWQCNFFVAVVSSDMRFHLYVCKQAVRDLEPVENTIKTDAYICAFIFIFSVLYPFIFMYIFGLRQSFLGITIVLSPSKPP